MAYTDLRTATRDELEADFELGREEVRQMPISQRMLRAVRTIDGPKAGAAVTRLEHVLQSATKALRHGRTEDYVVACLLHDVGDPWPADHGEFAAALLRPFLPEWITWIVEKHPVFTYYYWGGKVGGDPNGREKYRGHRWWDAAVEFAENYDASCFDPGYESLPLEVFESMLVRVFDERLYSPGQGSA